MLIRSPRHRFDDLSLWSDLEEADLLHAQSNRVERLVEQSRLAIVHFARPCYCGISWGKDSVVLAHLVWHTRPDVYLLFVRPANRLRTPERDAVRDAFLARFDVCYAESVIAYSFDEQEADKQFYRAFREAGSRYFSGIRGDESGGRMIRRWKHGTTSPNACAPLIDWRADDVFAYLALHDLPVHPCYAMLGGGRWDRHRIRVDDMGGDRGGRSGRREWEAEFYPDIINQLI